MLVPDEDCGESSSWLLQREANGLDTTAEPPCAAVSRFVFVFMYMCGRGPESEDNTLGSATTLASVLPWPAVAVLLLPVVVVVRVLCWSLAFVGSRVVALGVAGRWRVCSLLAQLSDDVEEGRFHVDAVFRRRLDELAVELFRKSAAFLCGDFSFRDAIALVADEHDRRWPEGCIHSL